MTRPRHEIRLLIEFLWRTLWGYNNFLLAQEFNEQFSQQLSFRLLGTGVAILETMHPAGNARSLSSPDADRRMALFLSAFQEEFNGYCEDWKELQEQYEGYPATITVTKYELAAAVRIDRLTGSFIEIYTA